MLDVLLAAVGLLGLVTAALSKPLRRTPLSEPLLALAAGMLLGPAVSGALDFPTVLEEQGWLHEACRVLLAISVMSIGLRYPLGEARTRLRPVLLLLVVALPVMAVVTAGLATVLLGMGAGAALLLGTALSPTDPVLASSVVTGGPAEEDLPAHDRQILSLESGANDGLALPLVLAAVAFAGPLSGVDAALEACWQVLGAVALGAVVGWLGARALTAGAEAGLTDRGALLLFTVLLALGALAASGLARVDGILAVFVCGLVYNGVVTGSEREAEVPIDEAVNRFGVLPLFLALGAAVPWQAWADLGWRGPALLVAVLLLRRLPVLLALRRPLGLSWPDAAYLGWFGPIGVSALFYLTLEADRLALPAEVLAAGTLVVVGSTVAHGLSSSPGPVLYRRFSGARRPAAGS